MGLKFVRQEGPRPTSKQVINQCVVVMCTTTLSDTELDEFHRVYKENATPDELDICTNLLIKGAERLCFMHPELIPLINTYSSDFKKGVKE